MFSHITQNWRGRPLVSHDVFINLIANTTTHAGLKIRAELDSGNPCYDIRAGGFSAQFRQHVGVDEVTQNATSRVALLSRSNSMSSDPYKGERRMNATKESPVCDKRS